MFFKRHGRYHALVGLFYLLWISMGFVVLAVGALIVDTRKGVANSNDAASYSSSPVPDVVFDIVLGTLGTVLTLSAAFEFKHKHVKNHASGTLDEHATVSYTEMIEHSFYQILNLVQIAFLHLFTFFPNMALWMRVMALFAATSPWLFRALYPINRFSDNYKKIDDRSTRLIRILYRIKKYQYVFYKHFILHGLNITVAVENLIILANAAPFRLFWLLLNLSYVMEFFLQTLVKKKYMKQQTMLHLQKILMAAASFSAVCVLMVVSFPVAIASLILHFTNRKHDVLNTMIVCLLYSIWAAVGSSVSF